MLSEAVRIRFSKTGKVKFISHLDLCRTFRTAFIRAGIPIWYSQGFNPHPKMVFATTVPVGGESLCELLDIKITSPMDEEEFKARLSSALTKDIGILGVYTPLRPFAELAYAEYRMELDAPVDPEKLSGLLTGELKVMKKTKNGDKLVDILPLIESASAFGNTLNCILAASQTMALGPDVFLRGIKPACPGDLISLMRTAVLTADLAPFE